MKIQRFQVTIAVPDENDPVKLVDVVDTLRNRIEEFGAENCAVEGKEVEKGEDLGRGRFKEEERKTKEKSK